MSSFGPRFALRKFRHLAARSATRGLLLAFALAASLNSGAAIGQQPDGQQPDGQQPDYSLGSGDQLRVTVFGQIDLSGEFQVDGTGAISMPLIGSVAADGLTERELERAIVDKLKPDYLKNPRVSVEVINYRPFYIIGEVKQPGRYPYVNGMKVINAVALAGGYTYRARENKLFIIRAKDPKQVKSAANHDTIVLPGDVIEVPERFF